MDPLGGQRPLREGLRESLVDVLSYRNNKPFSDLEIALGTVSFFLWLLEGISKNEYEGVEYFEAANYTARATATRFADSLYHPEVLEAIRVHIPTFNPHREVELALVKLFPGNPDWEEWEYCLTRSLILITRELAYKYLGVFGPTLSDYLGNAPIGDILDEVKLMLTEQLGARYADYFIPDA
ncbi:MAG: hypothetical protein GX047_04115 [Firmicutes bacterium]|nr:hypothetical protein [Bacillota bacterium]